MRLAVLSVFLALPLLAQDGKVIELSKSDAEKAQKAYAALQKAQTEWDSIRSDVQEKYLSTEQSVAAKGTSGKRGNLLWVKWDDFVFSENFKFIVPKPNEPARSLWGNGCIINTGITKPATNPAYWDDPKNFGTGVIIGSSPQPIIGSSGFVIPAH